MTRRKPRIYFDVEAPHRKAGKPLAYHFPLLAKIHLKGPYRKHKKAALYSGVFGLVVVLVLVFQIPALFANVRSFAPATCSGDWSNPTALLSGETGGSAVATDAGQKIFCSFASLNLKEPVVLERTMLVLSFESPLVQASESTSEVQEEVNGETQEESVLVEEESVTSTEESSEPEPIAESEVEEEPVIPAEEPAEEPEPTPEPAPEAQSEAPAAFLFTAVAHAQEVEVPVEPSPVEEAEPAPVELAPIEEIEPAPTEEAPAEESVTEEVVPEEEEILGEQTEEPIEESVPVPTEPEGSELTISYTIDGEIWTEVTTFTPRGNEVTFDLLVPTTAEFERLVIRMTADSIVENIELSDLEVRIWTETPLNELLQPFPVEDAVGSHVFTREFTIDPKATHYCEFDPLTVDLSSGTTTSFTLSLRKGDDLGQGVSGFIADVSEAILEVITDEHSPEPIVEELPEEPVASTTEETIVEETLEQELTEEGLEEVLVEETASTTEEVIVEETASTTEELVVEEEEQGFIEEMVESSIEVLEDLARIRVGMLEIGSLPLGIDIRFSGERPYTVDLFDDSPETFVLSAVIFALEGAQEGSFSVPLIFTRTDGKESTVVCQINVINRPGSVPLFVPEEPTTEPEVIEEPIPEVESAEEPVI